MAERGGPPVDIAQLVQRVDGQDHLSQIELGQLGWEAVLKAAQQGEEISASIVVHHQVLEGSESSKSRLRTGAPVNLTVVLAALGRQHQAVPLRTIMWLAFFLRQGLTM